MSYELCEVHVDSPTRLTIIRQHSKPNQDQTDLLVTQGSVYFSFFFFFCSHDFVPCCGTLWQCVPMLAGKCVTHSLDVFIPTSPFQRAEKLWRLMFVTG